MREEGVHSLLVQRDRAPARFRLRALHPNTTAIAWVAERADNPQPLGPGDGPVIEGPLELEVIPARGCELSPAQPGQHCGQHKGTVARIDGSATRSS